MSGLDFLIILFLVCGLVRGFMKGFIFELSGFLGIIAAIYVSRYHGDFFADILHTFFGIETLLPTLGVIVAFVFALVVVRVVAMVAAKLVKVVMLGWLDKLLGALFSLLKYALVASFAINVIDPVLDKFDAAKQTRTESTLYRSVEAFGPAVLPYLNLDELLELVKTGKIEPANQ